MAQSLLAMSAMSMLVSIVVTLIVVGVFLWAITQLPIDAAIARIIRVIVVVVAVLWVLGVATGYAPLLPIGNWRS